MCIKYYNEHSCNHVIKLKRYTKEKLLFFHSVVSLARENNRSAEKKLFFIMKTNQFNSAEIKKTIFLSSYTLYTRRNITETNIIILLFSYII